MAGRCLAMIPQSLDNCNWQELDTVKKGNVGEKIVKDYLEGRGYVLYKPVTEKAHTFDYLATKNKTAIYVVEVKTKPRRKYYRDTGIDYRHFKTYKTVSEKYKMDVFLFFVDDIERTIYGNEINNLLLPYSEKGKQYPIYEEHTKIIYFPLKHMIKISDLTDEQIKNIRKFHSGKYDYNKY